MTDPSAYIAASLIAAGAVLFAVELFHPGALLLIPGSVLLASGILYLFLPNVLLDSWVGIVVIAVCAVAAALLEIPYYRHISPGHPPMTTMPSTLIGKQGIVVSPVIPNTLKGKVRIGSEIWSAEGTHNIPTGTTVRVVSGEGVTVTVEPVASIAG